MKLFENINVGKVGKIALAIGGVVCTLGSALISDAKQKATITEEANKAAQKAVAEALKNQVEGS